MASADGLDQATPLDEAGSDEDETVSSSADEHSESDSGAQNENANGSGTKTKKARPGITCNRDAHCATTQKRKKRKKKGGEGGAANGSPGPSASERKAADARFQEALQLLAANDEDGMWIKLSNCFLQDAKVAKLCEAMANNTCVTSIDLSSNCLTNSAAHVLAAALTDKNNAPDLILLDVRGNSIDDHALDTLV